MRYNTFVLLLLLFSICASSGCGLFGGSNRKPRIEEVPPYYGKIERDGSGREYVNAPMEHSGVQKEPYKEHKQVPKNSVSSRDELEKLQKDADEYAAEESRKKTPEKSNTDKKGGFFSWFKSGKPTDGMSSEAKSVSESLEAKRLDMVR